MMMLCVYRSYNVALQLTIATGWLGWIVLYSCKQKTTRRIVPVNCFLMVVCVVYVITTMLYSCYYWVLIFYIYILYNRYDFSLSLSLFLCVSVYFYSYSYDTFTFFEAYILFLNSILYDPQNFIHRFQLLLPILPIVLTYLHVHLHHAKQIAF